MGFESARLAWDEYAKWLLRSPFEMVEGVTSGHKMAVLDKTHLSSREGEKWRETHGTWCGERRTIVCTL